jgi:hypothetical protein
MRGILVLGLVLGLALAGVVPCRAADQPIGAVKLSLTRSSSGTERLTFTSRDVHVLFPALGGADDPSVVGASVTLVSPYEAPVTLAIPPGIGNPGWRLTDRALDRYKFTNGASPGGSSVVRQLGLRENRGVKIVAREIGLALTAAQGSVGIRVTTGSLRSCARFDAPTIVVDQPGRFIARGAIAVGADCDDASLGASTTTTSSTTPTSSTLAPGCGNGAIDAGEDCDGTNIDGGPFGIGCYPPGSANECQFCGAPRCRYELGLEFPCCDESKTCVPLGPNGGECRGPEDAVCGNGAVEPGEQCELPFFPCSSGGCFPPGDPHECQCCGTDTSFCYDGPAFPATLCCPGFTCAHYTPQAAGGAFGLGECASTCAPMGTECGANGLSCCAGSCVQPDPMFPHSFCQ